MTQSLDFKTATSFLDDPELRPIIQNFPSKLFLGHQFKKIPPKNRLKALFEKITLFFQKLIHHIHAKLSSSYKNYFCYVAKVIDDQRKQKREEKKEDWEKKFEQAQRLKTLHILIKALEGEKKKQLAHLLGIEEKELEISDDFLEEEKNALVVISQKIQAPLSSTRKESLSLVSSIENFYQEASKSHQIVKEMFSLLFKDCQEFISSWNNSKLTLSKQVKVWVPSDEKCGSVFLLGKEIELDLKKDFVKIKSGFSIITKWQFTAVTATLFSFQVKGDSVEFCAGKSLISKTVSQKLTDLREKWGQGIVLSDSQSAEEYIKSKI